MDTGILIGMILTILMMFCVLNNSVKKFMETDNEWVKMFHFGLGSASLGMIVINVINMAKILSPLTSMSN